MGLQGKVSLITGGASGIGRATSLLFAKEGSKVVVADVDAKGGPSTVEEIGRAGGESFFVKVDVSRAGDVAAAVKAVADRYGHIDILFNNAGIAQSPKLVEEIAEEEWDRVMAVNLKGVFLFAKYALPYLKMTKGVVVNTASTAGLSPLRGVPAYCASKAGVILATKVMALEFAKYGVRVNCVCPSATETPLLDKLISLPSELGEAQRRRETLARSFPLGRVGRPEDVAKAVLYLASEDSGFVTGIALVVDGGHTLR